MTAVLNVNGKREGDSLNGDSPSSRPRLTCVDRPSQSPSPSMDISLGLKIMANVDHQNPFFTETAHGVIDAVARENPWMPDILEQLGLLLKEQGAIRAKLDAANSIWKQSLDLQVLRELASRIKTAEAAEGAIRTFMSGLKQTLGARITPGRENAIVNNLKACFTGLPPEDSVYPSASTPLPSKVAPTTMGPQERRPSSSSQASASLKIKGNADSGAKELDARMADVPRQGGKTAHDTDVGVDLAEIDRLIQEGQKKACPETTPAGPAGNTPTLPTPAKDDDSTSPSMNSPLEKLTSIYNTYPSTSVDSWHNVPTGPSIKEPLLKTEPDMLDRPLSDRIAAAEKPPNLLSHQMTCWFWLHQGHCMRGERCNYRHEILDYVAVYKPNSLSRPFRIIKRATLDETRRDTLAAMRLDEDHRQYDPYERPSTYEHRSSNEQRTRVSNGASLANSETPIVDALLGQVPVTLRGRDEVARTILGNIKTRRTNSSKDFVTQLYDANGKYTRYNIDNNDGIYSKMAGMWANARSESEFEPGRVRRMVENMLRPFVVANKSKFLDLPEHAFSANRVSQYA